MKTETKIERMEQLIRVMQGLSPHQKRKHLEMHEWGKITKCGMTMCAGGFCASDPWFKRRGLKLEQQTDELFQLQFRGHYSWHALHAFFGFEDARVAWGDVPYTPKSKEIFWSPKSVPEVIAAAKARIKELQE